MGFKVLLRMTLTPSPNNIFITNFATKRQANEEFY